MRIEIESADMLFDHPSKRRYQRLIKAYPQLQKYDLNKKDFTIEIKSVEEIFQLAEDLDYKLIISRSDNKRILIYDTWIE